jgi:hypothetical protein
MTASESAPITRDWVYLKLPIRPCPRQDRHDPPVQYVQLVQEAASRS